MVVLSNSSASFCVMSESNRQEKKGIINCIRLSLFKDNHADVEAEIPRPGISCFNTGTRLFWSLFIALDMSQVYDEMSHGRLDTLPRGLSSQWLGSAYCNALFNGHSLSIRCPLRMPMFISTGTCFSLELTTLVHGLIDLFHRPRFGMVNTQNDRKVKAVSGPLRPGLHIAQIDRSCHHRTVSADGNPLYLRAGTTIAGTRPRAKLS